jgi:hypothetical protein
LLYEEATATEIVSAFNNKKVNRRKTQEEIKKELYDPRDDWGNIVSYALNKNIRAMKKFDKKYPDYKKGLRIVLHQYCEYPKDYYGWTNAKQDKEDWIQNAIQEGAIFSKFGCFEVIEEAEDDDL